MAEFILKDRHGNSRTFDKETFYVRGADGELMPFTHGTGNPVLQPLEITENGTYTAPAGVDGYNPVTVNVDLDPTKVTILREQRFDGFVLDSNFGAYSPGYVTPAMFVLKNGETYHVIWDGTEYECVAFAFDFSGMPMVVIGNGSSLGLPGNGEPFLITYNASYDNTQLFSTDTKSSHTAGIWQEVKTEIKLQDKTITENGEYTADSGFDGLGKVTVDVAGSGSELMPKMYIELNSIPLPGGYSPKYFMLNGTLYALCNRFNILQSGEHTTNVYLIYKYVNGEWAQFNSTTYTLDSYTIYARRAVIVNQKCHIIGNSTNYHYIIDETNGLKKANNLPGSVSSQQVYSENGKLKILYNNKTYVWDESNDTWSQEGTPPTSSCNEVVSYKGKTYWKASGNSIYVREDGVDTLWCKATTFGTILCVKGNYIYSYSGGNIIRSDLETGASETFSLVSQTGFAKFDVLEDDAPIWYYGFYRRNATDCTANYVVRENV